MNYAFFGFEGTGFPIAKKLLDEGENVLVGQVENVKDILTTKEKKLRITEDRKDKEIRLKRYTNIVPKTSAKKLVEKLKQVKDPKEWFLFFESNCLFFHAQQLKQLGFHGNFPTEEDRIFETDRDFAKNFVKINYPNLKVAPKKVFSYINDATDFLRHSSTIWVVKSHTDEVPTFIPETEDSRLAAAQIIDYMNLHRLNFEQSGIFLEQKIPHVLEIDPEIMFYDGVPVSLCMDIENKFIGSANLSYQVGCAGDLNFPIAMDSKIYDMCFPKKVLTLAKEHKGLFIWDASILINSKTNEIFFSEFCPNRPRYNTIFTYLSQMPSVDHFFSSIVSQKNPFVMGSVASSISLFNLSHGDESIENLSVSVDKKDKRDTWLIDVYKNPNESNLRSIGYEQLLGVVTGHNTTLTSTVTDMYKHVEGVTAANIYYRPKFDFLSKEYPTSILNRLEYAVDHKLFSLPFSY